MGGPRIPIWDNHFHLDPAGGVERSAAEFARAGGTGFLLVHKPYGDSPRFARTVEDHARAFETTLALGDRVRKAHPELTVLVALAPHPAEFTKLLEAGVPIDEADAVQRGALDLAAGHVRAGRAVAMGEVGRPHWEGVDPVVWARANAQMEHAFALCRDLGVPAIIHCETGTPEVYADLAKHCDAVNLPRDRAVKHYSPPLVDETLNHGLFPSVLVGGDAAEEALRQGTRFVMETDFIDEPEVLLLAGAGWPPDLEGKRMARYKMFHTARERGLPKPEEGAGYRRVGVVGEVLGPKTVPKRTRALLASGAMSEAQAWTIHAENPKRLYGVEGRGLG